MDMASEHSAISFLHAITMRNRQGKKKWERERSVVMVRLQTSPKSTSLYPLKPKVKFHALSYFIVKLVYRIHDTPSAKKKDDWANAQVCTKMKEISSPGIDADVQHFQWTHFLNNNNSFVHISTHTTLCVRHCTFECWLITIASFTFYAILKYRIKNSSSAATHCILATIYFVCKCAIDGAATFCDLH